MRKNLIKARERLKISQAEVARRAKMSRSEYCRMEAGERDMKMSTAKRIAEVLGLNIDPDNIFENY